MSSKISEASLWYYFPVKIDFMIEKREKLNGTRTEKCGIKERISFFPGMFSFLSNMLVLNGCIVLKDVDNFNSISVCRFWENATILPAINLVRPDKCVAILSKNQSVAFISCWYWKSVNIPLMLRHQFSFFQDPSFLTVWCQYSI